MTDFSKMTDEEFDEGLRQILDEECAIEYLLTIPGIYEILSEHYHNEILTRWENDYYKDVDEDIDEERVALCFNNRIITC